MEYYAGDGSVLSDDLSDEGSDSQETHQRNALKNECIILDTNPYKTKWDLWVVIVLLFVAFTLPWRIAFYENDSTLWKIINYTIDGTFAIDMLLTFFTIIPDSQNGGFISDKKKIAISYLKGWFAVDLISILPIDKIAQGASAKLVQFTKFSRFSRFARLIRLFRIIRMAKMFRLCKDRKRIAGKVDFIKIDPVVARLLMFFIGVLFITHVMGCLWVIAATIDEEISWMRAYADSNFDDPSAPRPNIEWYMIAFYFVMTTITTVGYGDVTAKNMVEKIFAIIIMLVGVMTFSFVAGSLTSIITQFDHAQASLKTKLQTLNHIRKQYRLDGAFYNDLKSTIEIEHSKSLDGLKDLIEPLPLTMKIKLAKVVHRDVFNQFDFFTKIKERSFIAWVGHRLVPRQIDKDHAVYEESEEITGIYFVTDGQIVFVYRHEGKPAILTKMTRGKFFGFEDYVY